MDAKTLAVEICPHAQDGRLRGDLAGNIGEWIGRVGHHDQHRMRRGLHDLRDDLPINFRVLVQELEATLRIIAVRRSACLLVDAGRDEHNTGAGEVVIIPVRDRDFATQRYAVADVGGDRLRSLARAVDQDDFTGAPRMTAAMAQAQPTLPTRQFRFSLAFRDC